MTSSSGAILREPRLRINRHRRLCLSITAVLVALVFLAWCCLGCHRLVLR